LRLIGTLLPVFAGATSANAQPRDDGAHDRYKGMPEGYVIIEGDIAVPEDFPGRGSYASNLWPDGIVPYIFDEDVSQAQRNVALAAMAEWEAVAGVDFVEWDTQLWWIYIMNSDGNWSEVGWQGMWGQDIGILDWDEFIVAHELGHALGYWHEQSRADRDNYVLIHWDRIEEGKEHNFEIHEDQGPFGSGDYGPYDFDSLMHYNQCAFSICDVACWGDLQNCRTITVLPPNEHWQDDIGQQDHLSYWDATLMSFLYPFPHYRFVDHTHSGDEYGTFFEPFRTFVDGYAETPEGGVLWIQPGPYSAVGTWSTPMTIRAPLGGVTLCP
jgi:hypothetical protein